MIIAHNLAAINAERQLNIKNNDKAKAVQRLSSGYRINVAADDAAGLAISEKMRSMIRGLTRAKTNAEEGISLIQIGDGALNEIHAMLHRLKELAVEASNGSWIDKDRDMLQDELEQICEEIDSIAETTNFNTIYLFQNEGYEYERLGYPSDKPDETEDSGTTEGTTGGTQTNNSVQTLDDLLVNTGMDELNIVYVERIDAQVGTTQTPAGSSTLSKDITIGGKSLSQILKTEIIPNTVNNILENYPAFSYLKGSSIGIGLEYFSGGSSGEVALAYVGCDPKDIKEGMLTYTLGVNTDVLQNITDRSDPKLEELEATIAHEMIHAFMDEAMTAGMLTTVNPFPDWFVEGMAQTASGHGGWIGSFGLDISETSNNNDIRTAIQKNKLGSGTSASQYGTGYLACMYLGAVIAGGGTPAATVDASTISVGLTKLFNQVLSGDSLDNAINSLTGGKFKSSTNFRDEFNKSSDEIADFVRNLLNATGDGRGGIISGDLTAKDLTPDNDLGDSIKLFELNPDHTSVKNLYPDDYNIISGGTMSASGTPPTGFDPDLAGKEYGDFIVTGALGKDITYDSSTKTLAVTGSSDVTISLKGGLTSSSGKIVLQGGGDVKLNNLKLDAPDALKVEADTNITYVGVNHFGGIQLDNNTNIIFKGSGLIQADSFTSDDNKVTFIGGAIVIGDDGEGQLGTINTTVIIDKASVTADILSKPEDTSVPPNKLRPIDLPWDDYLIDLKEDIVSISFDDEESKMQIGNGESATIWLADDGSVAPTRHKIVVTDSAGVSKTLLAEFNATAGVFEWADIPRPFQVTKADGTDAVEGTDYHYEGDGKLVIDVAGDYTISGGTINIKDGVDLYGNIAIADNIGAVGVTLDGVECKPTNGDCAFDLGKGNTVTIELADGKENTFKSGDGYAGIQLGNNTDLKITGTGELKATGGTGGAGIGSGSGNQKSAFGSSIEIQGGTITAKGGSDGAGIGAGSSAAFGNIKISGGTIKEAIGGYGGAGIGGAYNAKVGDIEITNGTIYAESAAHGAGIGGGFGSSATNGTITISGGTITAISKAIDGTGIGAGCQGSTGNITITGTAHIVKAQGGERSAGIGASQNGNSSAARIEISGNARIDEARGGNDGAGIGSGSGSSIGDIVIETEEYVNAYGGTNGVGIGSGHGSFSIYKSSSVGDITIKKGIVYAEGDTDSTGIGAGRGSTSGDITIGDEQNPDNKVVVTAIGDMTNGGGHILSYGDTAHTDENAGTITITGSGTTVRPGKKGEGLYSTSGVTDEKVPPTPIYSYPVYLFQDDDGPLDAGVDSEGSGLLPLDTINGVDRDKISNIRISSDKGGMAWETDIIHKEPNLVSKDNDEKVVEIEDSDYAFLWLLGENQTLTITYDYIDAAGKTQKGTTKLNLIFYEDTGVFRVGDQEDPPVDPNPPEDPDPEEDPEKYGPGGIILQIGAREGQILEIPRFYLSVDALKMGNLDISTQTNAWDSLPILQYALGRVSKIRSIYGAYQNRLEHTVANLAQTAENLTATESRIRDADMAEEVMHFAKSSILTEAAQAMLAQARQLPNRVTELLQGIG